MFNSFHASPIFPFSRHFCPYLGFAVLSPARWSLHPTLSCIPVISPTSTFLFFSALPFQCKCLAIVCRCLFSFFPAIFLTVMLLRWSIPVVFCRTPVYCLSGPQYAAFLDFICYTQPTQDQVDSMQDGIILCDPGPLRPPTLERIQCSSTIIRNDRFSSCRHDTFSKRPQNIPVSQKTVGKLKPHKNLLRAMSKKSASVKQRKKL